MTFGTIIFYKFLFRVNIFRIFFFREFSGFPFQILQVFENFMILLWLANYFICYVKEKQMNISSKSFIHSKEISAICVELEIMRFYVWYFSLFSIFSQHMRYILVILFCLYFHHLIRHNSSMKEYVHTV